MKNFKIYLAGGMKNCTSWEEQTVWRQEVINHFIMKENIYGYNYKLTIIDPTEHYNFKSKLYDSDLEVMKFDLRHVKSSDLIIVNFNEPNSIGTAIELGVAYEKNIPIIGINESGEELHPWLTCSCDKIFSSLEDAVDYIIKFYLI